MWKIISVKIFICLILGSLRAQPISIGVPVCGIPTHQEVRILFSVVGPGSLQLGLSTDSLSKGKLVYFEGRECWKEGSYRQVEFLVQGLQPGRKYQYSLHSGKKQWSSPLYTFTTPVLWEWRMPAPDITVLMGSCMYINETAYDRPGTPYGKSTDILKTMSKLPADCMLWLGDNTYLREVDYSSPSGMYYRYRHTLLDSAVQALLGARPNAAIWDDHDFGPNDSDRSFEYKTQSLGLFQAFWPTPNPKGNTMPGAYGLVKLSDVEFFLMDNRYYRAPNKLKADDPNKSYWGKDQLQWLIDKLIASKATFKIIVNGNQVLNQHANPSKMETLEIFPNEKNALLNHLKDYKIPGVLFLSGDRHFTELLKMDRTGTYPLYDFTCSPLTSGPFEKIKETDEGNNPMRVQGSLVAEQNFGRLSVTGGKGARVLKLEVLDSAGKVKFDWSVKQEELQ